ncbi:MAG: tyrosine-type recombinase/integrase [Pseudomonadota bacterium]|nr:tyrosine-type recombinase/integrase [Pseudomonadota bacterium]
MRTKLTNTVIAKLAVPEGKQSIKLFDTDVGGLGVRKMASGVATFIFEMRPKGVGAMKQVKIGRCGDISVDHARARARELALDYTSPNFLQTEAARGQMPTFAEAVHLYDQLALSNKSATYREKTMGTLRRYAERPLAALKVTDVHRQHVAAIVTPLMRDGKDATAQMVWEAVSNVLTWAVKFGHRDDNPLIRLKPDFRKVARDRALSMEEVAAVWKAAEPLSEVHKAAVRLLILLPFRKTEFLSCRWTELDSQWLSIPPERTKNSDATSLFLSSFAAAQLPARRNDSDLIFTTNGKVATRLGSKILTKLREGAGIPQWQFHDFRRTFSTHMHEAVTERMNDQHFVIEACLNHRDGSRQGVAGIYNRAQYRAQKQAMLQAWSDLVEVAVGR